FFGDINDRDRVGKAFQGQTHVIHLAGFISYRRQDRRRLMEVNLAGVRSIVDAALRVPVQRLIHVSSVGAIGFDKKGRLVDESAPFNWPPYFHYMTSKHFGQRVVEDAVRLKGLNAIILNPASIMGPGDHVRGTPHNQLYNAIYRGLLFGSFAGGLGVVDVRDVAAIILKGLNRGRVGEKYLLVGANLSYPEILKVIAKQAERRVFPFRIPAFFLAAAGLALEGVSRVAGNKPLLTYAYGRLSGWTTFYDNSKSRQDFGHEYIPIEDTIRDSCRYFERTFMAS
ncbi:MAG: NAD-dependent epimerase/dehydratase family protein, partial [Acidobacteriota bacterium]